jgi:hypothetical protein
MSIVLYYSPIACSLVPYVTLTEAGAKFEVRNVNLRKGEQNVAVGTCVSSHAPRPEPYVRLSRIRLPPRVFDGKRCRIRSNVCATRTWLRVQYVLC